MNSTSQKACIFAGLVVTAYGIYTISNPATDGYIFGTVIAAVAGIGGFVIGALKAKEKE